MTKRASIWTAKALNLMARLTDEIAMRRSVWFLQTLDDSHLSDIGIGRADIEYAVRHGRGDNFERRSHQRARATGQAPEENVQRR